MQRGQSGKPQVPHMSDGGETAQKSQTHTIDGCRGYEPEHELNKHCQNLVSCSEVRIQKDSETFPETSLTFPLPSLNLP